MRFGLFGAAQAQRGGPDVDSAAGFKDYIEYLIEAEALGYHSAFIVEHHFTGFGQVSATLNLLTWIGAKTSTLRLGTAVLVLPWHNPVLLAEQAATVDLLSGGPAGFRDRQGLSPQRIRRLPHPDGGSRARGSRNPIDIITKSWTSNERFSFRGRFWQFDDIIVEPPTRQQPHPPFWQGAGHPDSIRRVAARGHNLLLDQFASIDETVNRFNTYKGAMLANGFGFDPSQVGVARAFFVARYGGREGGGDRAADDGAAPAACHQPATGWQQYGQHHGVFRHARSQRGSRTVRHAGRDLPQDRGDAGARRGLYSAERRRDVTSESAAVRQ